MTRAVRVPRVDDRCVIAWSDHGRPESIAGPWAGDLPGRPRRRNQLGGRRVDEGDDDHVVHVLERPHPSTTNADGHEALAELWRQVAAAATGEDDGPPVRHWPSAVVDPDGTDGVPAVAVAGLDRATARAIGARVGLDVVIELTETTRRLVPCGPGRSSRTRDRDSIGWTDIGWDDLDRWHDAHLLAATSAGVSLPDPARCRSCGSTHLAEISYGMPVAPPPPWIALGGCVIIIGGDQPAIACTECGGRP